MLDKLTYSSPARWENVQKNYAHTIFLGAFTFEYHSTDGYVDYVSEEEIFNLFIESPKVWEIQHYFDLLNSNGVKYDVAMVGDGMNTIGQFFDIFLCLDTHGAILIKIGV